MKIKKAVFLALTILMVNVLFNMIILAGLAIGDVPEGNIEWTDPQEKTLGLAEHFIRDNFIIEATDFNDNSTIITIYDGTSYQTCIPFCTGRVISKTLARMGDSFNVTDSSGILEMNVFVKDLKEIKGNVGAYEGGNVVVDERATIRTTVVGKPAPKLSILPLERKVNNRNFVDRIFTPGSEISINFSIKNEGKAVLKEMHLIINKRDIQDLPLLFPSDSLDRELPELKANESTVINFRFKAPSVVKSGNFKISANVTGKDEFGREYNATDSTYIIVKPWIENLVEVKKYVSEKVYIGDIVYVTLYVNNNGSSNISNVNLVENIPRGFESMDNLSNITNFTLRGYENKKIIYRLKPERPGIYIFPEGSSIVEWKGENGIDGGAVYNNKLSRVIVSGPFVELKKSGVIEGNNIKIDIDAKNFGDRTSVVKIKDLVPGESSIYRSLVVHPSSSVRFSYTIDKNNVTNMINNGKVTFQPVVAIVYDQFLYDNERYTQKAVSNYMVLDMTG